MTFHSTAGYFIGGAPIAVAGKVIIGLGGADWGANGHLYAFDAETGQRAWTFDFILSVSKHAILPAMSLILIGIGSWFLGMRSLVSNVVTEDYVVYAELAGVKSRRILSSYVMRNALVPQVTGLAISLGGIFNGAVITEKVFGYPGVGSLLVDAVYAGDYGLVLGVTTISIIGVSIGVLVIDLLYPLLDPRVKVS